VAGSVDDEVEASFREADLPVRAAGDRLTPVVAAPVVGLSTFALFGGGSV